MNKKYLSLGLGLVLSFSLVACGSQQATQEPPKEPDQAVQQTETVTQPIETKQAEPAEPKPLAEVDTVDTPAETAPADETETVEPAETVEVQLFTEVSETVYATGTVNLRSGPGTENAKVGSLNRGESVTRLGIGIDGTEAEGWSRIQLADESIVYVSNSYISTSKPAAQQQSKPQGGTTQQAKPSGTTQQAKPSGTTQQQTQQPQEDTPQIPAGQDFTGQDPFEMWKQGGHEGLKTEWTDEEKAGLANALNGG